MDLNDENKRLVKALPERYRRGKYDWLRTVNFCQNLMADNEVTKEEARELNEWCENIVDTENCGLLKDLSSKLFSIFADNRVYKRELAELNDSISELLKDYENNKRLTSQLVASLPKIEEPFPINFFNKRFYFSGWMISVSRNELKKLIPNLGGVMEWSLDNIDYLVYGTVASHTWKHGSYDHAITNALSLVNKGHNIAIISEETFIKGVCRYQGINIKDFATGLPNDPEKKKQISCSPGCLIALAIFILLVIIAGFFAQK
jgi:NAD-dependent DNA ligase